MNLDFIIIHAFTLDENHQPNKIHKQRLDYGPELYGEGFGRNIIVAGKLDNRDKKYFEETGVPISTTMKDYLLSKGVSEEIILEEPNGENTYDCTVNSFRGIILPKDWNSGVITSSEEHLPRIQIQTMKVMHQLGIKENGFRLFYSGPSIRHSGESEEEIERFVNHEENGIIYTLGRNK